MIRLAWAMFILLLLAAAMPAPAQNSELTLDQVVERHVEALGGLEKLQAIRTLRKTGTFVYNGLEHDLTVYQKRGVGCREEIDGLQEWGTANTPGETAVRVSRGKQAWMLWAGSEEVTPVEGMELTGFLQDAKLEDALVDYRAKGHRVELVGEENLEGTPVFHLRVTFAGGEAQDWFLDRQTFLLIRRSREVPADDYKAPFVWYYDDYREVAGTKIPFFVQAEEKIFTRDYAFDAIEANVSLDDALFQTPRPVKDPD